MNGLAKDFKNWHKYILCMCLFIASIAYAYTPTGNGDLVRYIDNFNFFGNMSFWEALAYQGSASDGRGQNLFILYFFYWVIGKIGDYHIAPAFTVFVIYYIGLYVTCDIGEKLQVRRREILYYIVFLLLSLNLNAIINNIRNIFAFALIGFAIYRDCFQNKKNIGTLVLYTLPVFFHSSAILFLILRLLIELPRKIRWVVTIILLATPSIVDIMHSNLHYISSDNYLALLFRFAIRKAYVFFNDTSSAWGLIVQQSGSQRLARVLYISIAVLFCISALNIILKKIKTTDFKIDVGFDKILLFNFYTGLCTIACVQMLMPEYWRFVSALILFGSIIYFFVLKNDIGRLRIALIKLSFLIMPFCTALWVRALFNSCVVTQLFYKPFISSPIIILVMDIFDMFFA